MKWVLIGLVRAYQFLISPLLGPTCRYYPSCSAYAVRALEVHGFFKGSWLATRRLLRCHPWSPGGVDHVPERKNHDHQHEIERTDQLGRSPVLRPATAGGPHTEQGA